MTTSVHDIPRAHAKLSASGAHRWMHCTASAWAESQYPDSTSEFAEEGTRAHGMGEDCLSLKMDTAAWREWHLEEMRKRLSHDPVAYQGALDEFDELYPDEMYEFVQDYVEYVLARVAEALGINPDAIIYFEQRVDFSPWVPEGFGTGDCVIIADGRLIVVDLKYGKGVFVDVTENEQLMLYGLGAWNMFRHLFDIKTVELHLYQPRINNIARWEVDVKQLVNWAESTVKPTADRVWYALETGDLSNVEFKPDVEVCQFCRAKVHCIARRDKMIAMTAYEFMDPVLMTDAQVIECLAEAAHLQKWAGDLETWALKQAEAGKQFKGKKLVEGRSNRRYTDVEAVKTVLTLEGYEPVQFMKPSKLIGLTDMTSLLKGKKTFEKLLGSLVNKPRGKPVLVDESDPRPALTNEARAAEGFDFD